MSEAHPSSAALHAVADVEKSQEIAIHETSDPDSTQDDKPQPGVQQVEAMAIMWSKTSLITTYVLIWVVYFVMLMQQSTATALLPYVASAFQLHSLTPTVYVLSSIFGGVCNLTIAKILDIFGRPHGYALGIFISTIGVVMMAATNSVQMYAAAQVFWTIGNTALLYTINIFVADTTSLRNRGLMSALTSSPNLITTWLGGPIAEAFLKSAGWRWAFGMFSIMIPILCLPLFGLMMWYSIKAEKQGVVSKKRETSIGRSILYYLREFDTVGLLLLSIGLALFLLPFNLYTYQALKWESPLIICLLVFGVLLLITFALWERFFATVTFIPFSLLLDRNVVGAWLLGLALFISYSCWTSLFGSYLQVVNNLSVTNASYVVQIYGFGSGLSAIATGLAIRYTGHFKAMTLYAAIPVYTLFMGLMIYFREPSMDIGYVVMCQIFISFTGGMMIITSQIAAMSAASHQHIAVVMAIVSMFSSIGGAIGGVVAGAIWQSIFPVKLLEYLPTEEMENYAMIYGMIEVQLSYPVGSPTRIAIQRAYSDAQSMMLTAGTAVWVLGFIGVAMWRNVDVRNVKRAARQVI